MKQVFVITLFLFSFSGLAMSELARQSANAADEQLSMQDYAREMKAAVESRMITDVKLACSGQGRAIAQDYGITLDCEEAIDAALDMGISERRIQEVIE